MQQRIQLTNKHLLTIRKQLCKEDSEYSTEQSKITYNGKIIKFIALAMNGSSHNDLNILFCERCLNEYSLYDGDNSAWTMEAHQVVLIWISHPQTMLHQ